MRKYLKILLVCSLCFFCKDGACQLHLAHTWSIAPSTPLNGKGFNLTAHYHLNSFDEFRGGLFLTEFTPTDTLRLVANYLSLDYAKGFKLKPEAFRRVGIYLGAGFFYGIEKEIRQTTERQTKRRITGLRLFTEIELTLFQQLSYSFRLGRSFAFGDKRSTNLELVTGVRFYF